MPIPLETAARSTSGTLTWPPDMYRHFAAWFDDLIHHEGHEIRDLQLDDRPAPDERGADTGAGVRRLGDRRVDHARSGRSDRAGRP